MDALDAGAFAYRFDADVPRHLQVVVWGPLLAREMGFEGWTYQDGGETGFVYHLSGRPVRLGQATATLTVVRRTGKAFLTAYLGGYPTDAPTEQRTLDVRGIVTEAELFLSRLAREPVRFVLSNEWTLLGPTTDPAAPRGRRTARASA